MNTDNRTKSIIAVILLLVPREAAAIELNNGTLDGPCAWASVVKVASTCTGTLVASGSVLTAGHCSVLSGNNVLFGEDAEDSQRSIDVSNCTLHPDYYTGTVGVDLKVCQIDPMTPAPNVPTIPLMVPTGPARDWLYDEAYGPQGPAEVRLVGMGINGGNESGIKLEGPAWLYAQVEHDGSPTKLRTGDELGLPLGPFTVLTSGDSGGPMFVEMPDGSWMQIGVAHSSAPGIFNYHEAAPSWLRWIESEAKDGEETTISPCHEYVDGEWVWYGDCEDSFPINPWESYEQDWANDCSGVTYGGGLYPNADVTPPVPGDKAPGPGGDSGGGWIEIQEFENLYPDALALASVGEFGEVPERDTIAAWFVAELESVAVHPFLGGIKRVGSTGSYPESVMTGDFDGDNVADKLYSDPYHACGQGRITIVLDDGSVSEWTRDTTGILGTAACKAHFGAAVAVADFDDDGYDDVAVTAPGDTVAGSIVQAGTFSVIYGSASGLTAAGDQLINQDSSGIQDSSEAYDFFGESLVASDFNCDGYADIAVGAPRDDYSTIFDAGMAHVIHGSAGGLSTTNSIWFQVGSVNGTVESGDHFGSALAAGNFNGDVNSTNGTECMDLAIGAPGEDLGSPSISDAGFVYIAHGGISGLTSTGDIELHQNISDIEDVEESADRFGAHLTAIDDGTYWGLNVQVPGESCSANPNVGLHRFYGSVTSISSTTDVVNCDEFSDPFNSRDYGVLAQLADYYAIRVLTDL
ncbi:trypsin-like serine protease [Nannocystaceae bacterium ST9]